MTKDELAEELTQIQLDGLGYGEIVSLARERIKQNLVKLSKIDLLEQYLYFGDSGELLEESSEKSVDNKSPL